MVGGVGVVEEGWGEDGFGGGEGGEHEGSLWVDGTGGGTRGRVDDSLLAEGLLRRVLLAWGSYTRARSFYGYAT